MGYQTGQSGLMKTIKWCKIPNRLLVHSLLLPNTEGKREAAGHKTSVWDITQFWKLHIYLHIMINTVRNKQPTSFNICWGMRKASEVFFWGHISALGGHQTGAGQDVGKCCHQCASRKNNASWGPGWVLMHASTGARSNLNRSTQAWLATPLFSPLLSQRKRRREARIVHSLGKRKRF